MNNNIDYTSFTEEDKMSLLKIIETYQNFEIAKDLEWIFKEEEELMRQKEKDISEIWDNRIKLLEMWILKVDIKDVDILLYSINSSVMKVLYQWKNLHWISWSFQWLTIWKVVYDLNYKNMSSDLIDLETINSHKRSTLTWLDRRYNHVKWLWRLLLEEYFKEITNQWIKTSWFFSLDTAIDFYKNEISRLIDEWKLKDMKIKWQTFSIKTNNYY